MQAIIYSLLPYEGAAAAPVATQEPSGRRLLRTPPSCAGDPCSNPEEECSCGVRCQSMGGAASGGSMIFYACS